MCSVIELQKPAWPATGGVSAETPFTFRGGHMPKSFLSFHDQIDFLKNEKRPPRDPAKRAFALYGLPDKLDFPFQLHQIKIALG